MPGGLLNLIAVGQANLILNGNPKKTFWKTSYCKYTNFGMQKFRLDFNGQRTLRLNEESKFTFKYPRYGDLVMDSYLAITIPNIWSPLFPIQDNKNNSDSNKTCNPIYSNDLCNSNLYLCNNTYYIPYNFKWIENLGITMIQEIEVTVGGQTLQKYTGEYLSSMISRDFSTEKKALINLMSGNIKYYNDPQYAETNTTKKYPNAVFNDSAAGAEPSIRGRTIYIPLNLWFGMTSKQAFPLVALQYNELQVHVTIKPIKDLFVIRDVQNPYNNYSWKAPNFNEPSDQLYRFLQKPNGVPRRIPITDEIVTDQLTAQFGTYINKYNVSELGPPETTEDFYNSYTDKRNLWDSDIHIISTYAFLSDDERRVFASQPQEYLIKEVFEQDFYNIVDSVKLDLNSMGMVSSWMWFARRNDVYLRNQWNNYTNWKFSKNPNTIDIPTQNYTPIQPWYDNIDCSGNTSKRSYNGCYSCYYGNSSDLQCSDQDLYENRFKPYNNQFIKLPSTNPYASSNFNKWLRSREFNIDPDNLFRGTDNTTSISKSGNQTLLDQKGFYPPSTDIILDYQKGPYIGAAAVNEINGQLIAPVWKEQGSINTNYPIYCKISSTYESSNNTVCVESVGQFINDNIIETDDESTINFYQNSNLVSLLNGTVDISSEKGKLMYFSLNMKEKQFLSQELNSKKNNSDPILDTLLGENSFSYQNQNISSQDTNCTRTEPLGNFFGSPYENTAFPLCWGSSNILPSPFSTSGKYSQENSYAIIKNCGILLDGKIRENLMDSGIYEFLEKYQRSNGSGIEAEGGLQCYNFCLHTNPYDLQPSGAMNLSKFNTIQLELTTITPPLDPKAQYANICKEEVLPDGTLESIQIGVNKTSWSIYEYTYDIHFMEERYNIVKFIGGNVGLEFSR